MGNGTRMYDKEYDEDEDEDTKCATKHAKTWFWCICDFNKSCQAKLLIRKSEHREWKSGKEKFGPVKIKI